MFTFGCVLGGINLAIMAASGQLASLGMRAITRAHAHAQVAGWVTFSVMGFAYQSIPRFKFTTLWQPLLASRSLFVKQPRSPSEHWRTCGSASGMGPGQQNRRRRGTGRPDTAVASGRLAIGPRTKVFEIIGWRHIPAVWLQHDRKSDGAKGYSRALSAWSRHAATSMSILRLFEGVLNKLVLKSCGGPDNLIHLAGPLGP
jgi:hypothetical protein